MKNVLYYAIRAVLIPIVLFPYPFYLGVGRALFFLLYYVFGYRRQVTMQNLRLSFPHASQTELDILARRYYMYLGDLISEIMKTLFFSQKKALQHCHLSEEATALFNQYALQNQSIIVVMGHVGNWEWASHAFKLACPQPLYVLYRPLSNSAFDQLMQAIRTRFGTQLVAMNDTLRHMLAQRGETHVTTFISDQTPPPQTAYWTTFLNQETPVFTGIEKLARRFNYPVVYACVKRIRRGYYIVEAETLCNNPLSLSDNALTELHTRRLEKDILENPETWLWSHRRWKHKRPL